MLETIQNFFKNFDWSVKSLLKVSGAALAGLVVLSVALTIVSVVLSTRQRMVGMMNPYGNSFGVASSVAMRVPAPSMMQKVANYAMLMGGGDGMMESGAMSAPAADMMEVPQMPGMLQVNGSRNAELYQRTGYSASYETRRFKEMCTKIEDLKPLSYVLFDSANQSERYCSYSFRVEKAHEQEVVATLKALDPKEWNVSIDSVAQNIENTEDRIQILKRRLASVDATLTDSEQAFARLSSLATQAGRVSDLTNIITQKLSMVERLTNEKLSLEEQIRQMTGGKGDQIEETTYAQFSVSVSKWSAIDWQSLKDSWKYRTQETLRSVSDTFASIVLTIPAFVLSLLWYALVIGITILAGTAFTKYMTRIVKAIWNW